MFAVPSALLLAAWSHSQLAAAGAAPPPPSSGRGGPMARSAARGDKPPAFFLAGDSMTAVQSSEGGGWGNGFLSFLRAPAWGTNYGHDGATTVSFVSGGDWGEVISSVEGSAADYDPFVTIMFGANDQKAAANISLSQYQTNLESLAEQVQEAGGTPILVTPLSRRNFATEYSVTQNLADQRTYTIYAAGNASAWYVDLNRASTGYLDAVGNATAQTYDLACDDQTHLNDWGSVVFGRMVADLVLGHPPEVEGAAAAAAENWTPPADGPLTEWFVPNATLSGLIWSGVAAYGGDCPLGI